MKQIQILFYCVLTVIIILFHSGATGKSPPATGILTLDRFIREACRKDTNFQEILAAEMALKYNKILKLPSRDILIAAKGQYNVDIAEDETTGPEGSISLSKLFPETGTEVYAGYSTSPSRTSTKNATAFNAYISQPIARNAFGSETRLSKKIIGIENDIARHQIVEAYEDYLASLIALYYQWYSDSENVKTARSAYQQSAKLLRNIRLRYRNRIAHRSDVGRINLQALEKKEALMTIETQFRTTRNLVYQAIRHSGNKELFPRYNPFGQNQPDDFDRAYTAFKTKGRTHRMLRLLEKQKKLSVKLNAKALLPSASLLIGYTREKNPSLNRTYKREVAYFGIQLDFPLFRSQEKASQEVAKIDSHTTELSVQNTTLRLESDLKKIFREMSLEKKLVTLYEQKVRLSRLVMNDMRIKYGQARSSLKDLIEAIDSYDENRYKMVLHRVKHSVLTVEWLRMTDSLISGKEMRNRTKIRFRQDFSEP